VNETTMTIVGNLVETPTLTYLDSGVPVAGFTIASTSRRFDRAENRWVDTDTLFLRAQAWRDLAEHTASSLSRGDRVVATGRLKQRSFETRDGERRTVIELEVDEIGPSLRYATFSRGFTESEGSSARNPRTETAS